MTEGAASVEQVEVVLPCAELDPTVAFFTQRLGFRVGAVFPADDPVVAVLVGHGARLRLQRGLDADPGTLRVACSDPETVGGGRTQLVAPNGTRIELVAARPPLVLPPLRPSLCVERRRDAKWITGRAGMRYRDLIPDRQGGRFIASHICIPNGGPVPDYVHYHVVRFQMIYCYRGWVRVVYEDQGPSFVLQAGDCVLQPPRIRHRVLEASPGLEVVEVGCPDEHETHADLELELPTPDVVAGRDFSGQRFVRHKAANATWHADTVAGFDSRDTGIAAATDGLADVRVLRPTADAPTSNAAHEHELLLFFVLEGQVSLHCEGRPEHALAAGDAVVVPPRHPYALTPDGADTQLLRVTVTRSDPDS